jgi:hypothetical protein
MVQGVLVLTREHPRERLNEAAAIAIRDRTFRYEPF